MSGRPRGRPSRRRLRLFVKDEAKSNSDHSGNEEANESAEEANATATGKDSDQQEVSAPRRRGRPRIYPRPGTSNGEVVPVKKRRRDEGDSTDDDGEIDPEGEKKVDRQGHLLEGREYRVPTFELPERGDQQLMFAMEPARILGYRDSYLLFMKNADLVRVRISDVAKNELVEQKMLLPWFRNRDVAIVTARSIYKVFGAKVVKGGRRCKDDYYEAKARAEGYTDELEDTEMEEAFARRTQLSSHTTKLPGSNVPSTAVSGPGWMHHAALSVQEFNARLRQRRIEKPSFYDVHTNIQQVPVATQPDSCEFECVSAKNSTSDEITIDPVKFIRPSRKRPFFDSTALNIVDDVNYHSVYEVIPPESKLAMEKAGIEFFAEQDINITKDEQYPIALLDGQYQESFPIHHVRFAINAPKIFSPVSITKATRAILTQQQFVNSQHSASTIPMASQAGPVASIRSSVPLFGLEQKSSTPRPIPTRLNDTSTHQLSSKVSLPIRASASASASASAPSPAKASAPTPVSPTLVCGYITDNGDRCPLPVSKKGERCQDHANNYAKFPPSIAKETGKHTNTAYNKCAECHFLSAPPEVLKGLTPICETFSIIKCTNCHKKYHPVCSHLKTPRQLAAVESYPWLCPDCKICCVCQTVGDESTLMICDDCDRGWHTSCCNPKVENIPEGIWRCPLCAQCHSCGGKEIKKENKLNYPYKHAIAPPTDHYKYPIYLATYCKVCHDNFTKDRFCPVCLKTYSEDGDDEEDHDMVACDNCDYWVHVGCDEALTPERYQKLCDDEDEKYGCPLCEKRVKANVDTGQAALALKGVSAPSGTCVGMAGGKVKIRGVVHYREKQVGVPEINGTGIAVVKI